MRIITFGYRKRPPPQADHLLDARCLPNPYTVARLRTLDGRDPAVQNWLVTRRPSLPGTVASFTDALVHAQPNATLAIGCLGGRHRSVALGELIARRCRELDIPVEVIHLELSGLVDEAGLEAP